MKTLQLSKQIFVVFVLLLVLGFTTNINSQTYFNHNDSTGLSNAFPFSQNAGKAVNLLIRPGEFGPVPSGNQITTIYFLISTTTGTRTFNELRILMAQDVITDLNASHFYDGPYDTVYYRASETFTYVNNRWFSITLDHPFVYDTSKSLILFIGQCSSSGNSMNVRNKIFSGGRRVWSIGGCPFLPYNSVDAAVTGIGIDVSPVTGITGIGNEIPSAFSLEQNYPNPFNSSSNMKFKVASSKFVKLVVFDLLGREVRTLVNEALQAGTYQVRFDAGDLPSGVYFYRLTAGDFSETKKLILMK